MNIPSPTVFLAALLAIALGSVVQAADGPRRTKAQTKASQPVGGTSSVRPGREPDKIVVFKKTPQTELKAHIYFPPGWSASDQRPAIVFWSGGAFRTGAVGQFLAKAEYFSTRGLVAICAQYRGRNTHGILIDSCAEDARSAMRWIKGHARELGISPNKVIASGGSAGGTLSFLVAREKGPDAKDDDLTISPRPAALVLFNPAVGDHVLEVIGRGGPEQAAVNAQIVALDTPQPDEPPVVMFYGTKDRFLAVAREFNRKAQALGRRCEVWLAEGMGHAFFNDQPWHDATTRKADEFLVSLGYLKGSPTIKDNPAARLTLMGKE